MCGYRTLTGARAPPTGPQAEGDVGPPFSGKRERAPALSLLPPWVLVRLSSSLGRLLKGIHPPFRPIACPGKAADPGSSPQKTQRTPLTFPPQPTRPAGHASQSFPARRRGKKMKSCFDRLRRPKHTSHPESAGFAGAGRGATPNFGRGLQPSRTPTAPVHCPPERSANLPRPSQNSHRKRD